MTLPVVRKGQEVPGDLTALRRARGVNPFATRPLTANGPSTDTNAISTSQVYTTYAGTDIVAQIVLPSCDPVILGELQTLSYSMHRENLPVRLLGKSGVVGFVKGARTIAGSLIFTVFNYYPWYRYKAFGKAVERGLYPLADMLPPFDIVITFANESGSMSKMKIYGCTIIDEGQTMSVDDLVTEQTYMFMARGIQPMTGFVVGNPNYLLEETGQLSPPVTTVQF